MAYCVSKDMGQGNAPAFLHGITHVGAVWSTLDQASSYPDESSAQAVIDNHDLFDCIVMPLEQSVEIGGDHE